MPYPSQSPVLNCSQPLDAQCALSLFIHGLMQKLLLYEKLPFLLSFSLLTLNG